MKKLALLGLAAALALAAPAFAADTAAPATKAPAAAVKTVAKKATESTKLPLAVAALKKAEKDLTGNEDAHAVKALDLVKNALQELQPAPAAK
ncbi:MAG: hypothetical protein GC185_13650 [Alphaproteobacteria bacterium]|nr:hypothetical protein [Alphaproteobacteria bacterium]